MSLNDKTDRRINLDKPQIAQSPRLDNINEEKTIVERIRNLELQVVELHQYLDMEKTKVDLLRDIVGIDKKDNF
jgi:hypothetical protein